MNPREIRLAALHLTHGIEKEAAEPGKAGAIERLLEAVRTTQTGRTMEDAWTRHGGFGGSPVVGTLTGAQDVLTKSPKIAAAVGAGAGLATNELADGDMALASMPIGAATMVLAAKFRGQPAAFKQAVRELHEFEQSGKKISEFPLIAKIEAERRSAVLSAGAWKNQKELAPLQKAFEDASANVARLKESAKGRPPSAEDIKTLDNARAAQAEAEKAIASMQKGHADDALKFKDDVLEPRKLSSASGDALHFKLDPLGNLKAQAKRDNATHQTVVTNPITTKMETLQANTPLAAGAAAGIGALGYRAVSSPKQGGASVDTAGVAEEANKKLDALQKKPEPAGNSEQFNNALIGGGIGGLGGAALGYGISDPADEEKRRRNALIGALTGGGLGVMAGGFAGGMDKAASAQVETRAGNIDWALRKLGVAQ